MKTFEELFQLMDVDVMIKVIAFHTKFTKELDLMPASIKHHHCWVGGYKTHVLEVMNNALVIDATVPLPKKDYTLSELLLAAYVHDLDKLFCRYMLDPEKPTDRQLDFARNLGIHITAHESKSSISYKIDMTKAGKPVDITKAPVFIMRDDIPSFSAAAMVCKLCYENGIKLSDNVLHAVAWHEGGFSPGIDYRVELEPIAAVLHAADLLSSIGQNGA